jgi:hypothetical protein
MSDHEPRAPVNPLVEDLLKREARAVSLRGYVGPAESGRVRLYSDLSLTRFVEIPDDAIVHVRQARNDPEARRTVVFDGSTRVRYVQETILRVEDAIAQAHSTAGCVGCGSQNASTSQEQLRLRRFPWETVPNPCAALCRAALDTCIFYAQGRVDEQIWCYMDSWVCLEKCPPTLYDFEQGGVIT